MADYSASVLAKAQTILTDRFQQAEMRMKPSATLMQLMKQRDMFFPDLGMLRTREDRPTNAYLKNRVVRPLGVARSFDHTGDPSDSTEVPITFASYVDEFSTSLKRGDNNVFSDAEILAHEIENSLKNLHEGIESDLVTFLDANKNTVSAPPSGAVQRAPFNVVNGAYEIAGADSDEFWNIMKSAFRQEKYMESMFTVVADSIKVSEGEFLANQGTGNSTNLGFQFSGMDVAESIEIADANYTAGIAFGWANGLAGILDWIPRQNRQGKGNIDSNLGGYSTITDPLTGLQFAVHGYTERADTASANGNAQDEVTQWELSIDLSPNVAPQSTAGASPIFLFGQL